MVFCHGCLNILKQMGYIFYHITFSISLANRPQVWKARGPKLESQFWRVTTSTSSWSEACIEARGTEVLWEGPISGKEAVSMASRTGILALHSARRDRARGQRWKILWGEDTHPEAGDRCRDWESGRRKVAD